MSERQVIDVYKAGEGALRAIGMAPLKGDGAPWNLPEGDLAYWRAHLDEIDHEVSE